MVERRFGPGREGSEEGGVGFVGDDRVEGFSVSVVPPLSRESM
jgi:hypothetical protein